MWALDPDTASDDVCTWCEGVLSAGEGERRRKFLREADGRTYLLAHGLVRAVLSRYAEVAASDWTFAAGEHGRPEIEKPSAPPGLRFNLSHTRGRIVVLVHGAVDAGVDVERLGRVDDPAALSRRFFAPAENASLSSLTPPERDAYFTRLWTLKEAYVKARGLGLASIGKKLSFQARDAGDIRIQFSEDFDDEASNWSFTASPSGDQHVLATAARRNPDGSARAVRHFS